MRGGGEGVHLCGRLLVEVGGLSARGLGERKEVLDPLAVLQLTDLESVVLGMQPQHLLPLLEQKHLRGTRPPSSGSHTAQTLQWVLKLSLRDALQCWVYFSRATLVQCKYM